MILEDLARVRWIHGAPDCAASTEPPLQVHEVDARTYVLRQGKCSNFEAPFLYLLCGEESALLVGTGARPDSGTALPLRETVDRLMDRLGGRALHLVVAHTHGHGDHAAQDDQFMDRPHTTVVAPDLPAIQAFFGLDDWPNQLGAFDLGERRITVIPVPGHEAAHVALYDARTRALLTGDNVYPGLLVIRDWDAYVRSIERLVGFAAHNDVACLLGSHIEMTSTPAVHYPYGTTYQPDEHVLPLGVEHLQELHDALVAMQGRPRRQVHSDFVIQPV